jgi:hypothetical protein
VTMFERREVELLTQAVAAIFTLFLRCKRFFSFFSDLFLSSRLKNVSFVPISIFGFREKT